MFPQHPAFRSGIARVPYNGQEHQALFEEGVCDQSEDAFPYGYLGRVPREINIGLIHHFYGSLRSHPLSRSSLIVEQSLDEYCVLNEPPYSGELVKASSQKDAGKGLCYSATEYSLSYATG